MNTKALVAVVALALVGGGAYWAAMQVHSKPTTTPLEVFGTAAATSSSGGTQAPATEATAGVQKDPSGPTVVQGTPVRHVVHQTLAFAGPTFTTKDRNPTLNGTGSNIESAQLLIKNSAGVGVEAATVAIVDGHWSYSSPLTLTPGTYTVLLGTPEFSVQAKLVIL